ncbi:hypothetical protein GCM10010466_24990 [Planomonospora alba]|uniref:Metalloprotease-like protein n=1 Tax=Planomonospora alba TaxID=161354 RepID=A0ABP6N3M2_9ACTN
MRILLPAGGSRRVLGILAAAVCLAAPPYGAAAQAAPPEKPPGTPLVRTGRLAAVECSEPPITDGGIPRAREYLTAAVACLNRSWSAHLARAGLRFRAPRVRFYDEPVARVCGQRWPHADAFYCTEQGTLVFPLTGPWIEDRTDLYPFKQAAHEYGHHLQSLTGIRAAYERRAARARGALLTELKRRYELQADCLAGVFLGSVRHSLPRTGRDWAALSEAIRRSGDDEADRLHGTVTHGDGADRLRWFTRGYGALSPSACDTWSAKRSWVS